MSNLSIARNSFELTLAVGLLLVYFIVPDGFSPLIAGVTISIFGILFVRALQIPTQFQSGKQTQFHGEILFLMFCYMLYFHPYLIASLGKLDITQHSKFRLNYSEYSNQAMILSTLGVVGFCLGCRAKFRSIIEDPTVKTAARSYPAIILALQVAALGIFFGSGGSSWLFGSYDRSSQVGGGLNEIYFLATFATLQSIASSLVRIHIGRLRYIDLVSLGLALIWGGALFLIGDRNSLFLVLMAAVAFYAAFKWRVRFPALLAMAAVAITLYSGIEASRRLTDRSLSNIISEVVSPENRESIEDSNMSTTTTGVRAAIAFIPEQVGYSNGRFSWIGLLGIVPKLRSLVVDRTKEFGRSAEILTLALVGPNASYGVGTSVVADLYADLGIGFVLVGCYLLGRAWSWIRMRALKRPYDHDRLVLFIVATAVFAEIPRYGLAFGVRPLAWTLILIAIARFIDRLSFRT